MPSPSRKKILCASFGRFIKHPPGFVSPFGTPQEIIKKVDADLKNCHEAGFDVEHYEMNPEELEATLRGFEEKIQSQQHWDAILIGFGIRAMPMHTVLFERTMDVCRRVGSEVPWCFSDGPSGNLDAFRRLFPEMQGELRNDPVHE